MAKNPSLGTKDALGRDMVLRWRPYLEKHASNGEDIGVLLGGIRMESGGNPCATGGDLDGDGENDEFGIAQFNIAIGRKIGKPGQLIGEDGKTELGYTVAQIVAACHADGSPPTDAEMDDQAGATVALFRNGMDIANAAIEKTGVEWGPDTEHYWALVKQSHASGPGGVHVLAEVVKDLGKSITYQQFADHVCTVLPSHRLAPYGLVGLRFGQSQFTPPTRNRLDDCYVNAMASASFMDGTRGSGGLNIGTIVCVLVLLWALTGGAM